MCEGASATCSVGQWSTWGMAVLSAVRSTNCQALDAAACAAISALNVVAVVESALASAASFHAWRRRVTHVNRSGILSTQQDAWRASMQGLRGALSGALQPCSLVRLIVGFRPEGTHLFT